MASSSSPSFPITLTHVERSDDQRIAHTQADLVQAEWDGYRAATPAQVARTEAAQAELEKDTTPPAPGKTK